MSAWGLLAIAIIFEVMGTSLLKLSNGFEKWQWGVLALACYVLSLSVLAPSLKVIPVGVAYAIWSGVGIASITIIGLFFFDERLAALQYCFIALILIGAVGLQFMSRN